MNFKRKGWFKKYVDFRESKPFDKELPTQGLKVKEEDASREAMDQAIYCFLQPTGLLYGFPFGLPFDENLYPKLKYYDSSDKAQLVFLESLYASLVAGKNQIEYEDREEKVLFKESVDHSIDYFVKQKVLGDKKQIISQSLDLKKIILDKYHQFERSLKKRIHFDFNPVDFTAYFHNSLIFLDLYFCILQQRLSKGRSGDTEWGTGNITEKQILIRKTLLRLIIIAAHANKSIESQETKLFEQFLFSSHLPKKERSRLRKEFKAGMDLDELELPKVPWILRRYLLEISLLTVMADHDVDQAEHTFLDRLINKLVLPITELDQSYTALETFLMKYEDKLRLLKYRPKMYHISSRIQERAAKVMAQNRDRLKQELQESRELYVLLIKSRTQTLTPGEKEKVRKQLIDVLKTIPVFVIIALPGTFMTLPVLLRILPSSVYPTAFQE